MTLLRNESKIMLYDKKMLDRYPAKDEENLRGVPMIEKWQSIIYSTGYIGSKYLNITYSVKKCVIKIYIATPEKINFLCYYVYSYRFQWNDNVNINYPAEYEIGDIVFTCIGAALFGQISAASNCWSNHVGIIIGHNGEDFLLQKAGFPFQPSPRYLVLLNVRLINAML